MVVKISILLVNLNNLEYTKDCLNDLLNQDIVFNLRLIDQNSSEFGTKDFFDEFFRRHQNGDFYGKINFLEVLNTGFNIPLNHLWNEYMNESLTDFVCLLNNDVKVSPNFLSSAVTILENEPNVGVVNHITNNIKFSSWSDSLNYIVMENPYRQGWDPIFRKSCYNKIPENLNFFYGDDFIYSKLYESGYKGAYVLNSPMIHFERSTTTEKGGLRDCSEDGNFFSSLNLCYKNLTFNEELCRWKPEFSEILKTDRISIINNIIEKNNFKNYLEIGVRDTSDCFDLINCKSKDSVDPGFEREINNVKYKLTSDEFFKQLDLGNLDKDSKYKWDIIFIDGLHLSYQVDLDIKNSLKHLSENGIIVVHDCNPPTLSHAREDYSNYNTTAKALWNGTVWKTFFKMRCTENNLDMCVINCDWGVGLIKRGSQILCGIHNPYFEYSIFDKHRVKSLNLIQVNQYQDWLLNPFY
jgi:GT2 family glycosyltransferase